MILVNGGELQHNGKTYKCAFGKNGFSADKKEGDNCTPIGEFFLREVLYRPDKIAKPQTKLPITEIKKDDGWCDASGNVNYNRKIKLPYNASCEILWRDDDVYDLVIPISYNDNPPISGKGSAIFIHIARGGYEGTEGCIALKLDELLALLKDADTNTKIWIQDGN